MPADALCHSGGAFTPHGGYAGAKPRRPPTSQPSFLRVRVRSRTCYLFPSDVRDHFERRWGACDTSRSSFELPPVVLWHACLPRSGERKNMNLPNVHARALQSFVCHRSLFILVSFCIAFAGQSRLSRYNSRDCEVRGEHGKRGQSERCIICECRSKSIFPFFSQRTLTICRTSL